MPAVSVIVPNYNHARFLPERLDSIFNQTFQDFEVILLDDCSTDDSVEILTKYAANPKVSQFIVNTVNSGSPFLQWGKGIAHAQGEIVWIAESDDVAAKNFLEVLIQPLQEKSAIVLSYCRSVSVDEESKVLYPDYYWPDLLDSVRWRQNFENAGVEEVKNFLIYRNTIPNASACLFRRSAAIVSESIVSMKYCGDWLFWGHLIRRGQLHFNHQTLNFFRSHSSSSREKKSTGQEIKRLTEYFQVISHLRELSGVGNIKTNEIKKYTWMGVQLPLIGLLNWKIIRFNPLIWLYFIYLRTVRAFYSFCFALLHILKKSHRNLLKKYIFRNY